MTELDAVNEVLEAAGRSPVSTLAGSNPKGPVQLIRNALKRAREQLSQEGWSYNISVSMTLQADVDGKVRIPSNVIRVERTYTNGIIQRGHYLYDTRDNTDIINSDVDIDAIIIVPFEELAYPVQWATTRRAAVRYLTNNETGGDLNAAMMAGIQAMGQLMQAEVELGGFDYRATKNTRDLAVRPHEPRTYF